MSDPLATPESIVFPHIRALPLETPTLPPATHTNTYVVGSGEAVLIEPATPHPSEQRRLLAWIEELRALGVEIGAVWLTHHHIDHIGAIDAVRAALDVPVLAHPRTVERLEGVATFDGTIDDKDVFDLDGPTPMRLHALHTPGHAPGHLCFLEEDTGTMIAGDMVAGVGTILVEPNDGDMALYLASLERMRRAGPRALLPAHGPALLEADRVLAGYVQHRLMREHSIVDALTRLGPAAVPDLVREVYRDVPRAAWPLAEQSTAAHLIKLDQDGRATPLPDGRWAAA